MRNLSIVLFLLALLTPASMSSAESVDYFVAIDGLETLTSGTFAGLPNPNAGRLTLLVAHRSDEDPAGNHFHAIGAYSYASIEGGPAFVIATSATNRIPELSTGFLPLTLHPGDGTWRRYVTSVATESEYSNLRLASIQSLADFPPDSPDGILFRSSGGRWTTPFDEARVALQRVSLTPGLSVADEYGNPILVERVHVMGDGRSLELAPTYFTHRLAAAGTYSATLKLVDLQPGGGGVAESGRFTFDFRVPKRGDLDGDNDVDGDDLRILDEALGSTATGRDDGRDLDGDGRIDRADRRILLRLKAGDRIR